jgi:hypothetical protein
MKIVITEVPNELGDKSTALRALRKIANLGFMEAVDIYDYVAQGGGDMEIEVDSIFSPAKVQQQFAEAGFTTELVDTPRAPKTIIVTYSGREAYVYETVGEVSNLMAQVRADMNAYDGLVPLEPNTLIHVDRIEMLAEIQED